MNRAMYGCNDENGKIISAQDLQKQTTTYEYQNNDLVRAITRDGSTIKAKMDYTYENDLVKTFENPGQTLYRKGLGHYAQNPVLA